MVYTIHTASIFIVYTLYHNNILLLINYEKKTITARDLKNRIYRNDKCTIIYANQINVYIII